ncbi:MAG: hypothetical protein H0X24_09800 [Ktedonobacterales bacterium]|nr:hypothetical protein [Ktedonobacterales bacterium]
MAHPTDSPEVAAAIEDIAAYWGHMAQQWPWMRQQSLRPVYILTGELLQALVRAYPAMLTSNQMRWYARARNNTPSIYVLFPDHFEQEAQKRVGSTDPHLLEGKTALTFVYLATVDGQTEVAKTLLISTERAAPLFRAQLAHELLNCATATDWDGQVMRAGFRRVTFGAGAPLQWGALLGDLLIDTLLLDFLPTLQSYTRADLFDGQQGPYWRIAEALGNKLPRAAVLDALFGPTPARDALSGLLNEAFERGDAATWLDRLISERKWDVLGEALGVSE